MYMTTEICDRTPVIGARKALKTLQTFGIQGTNSCSGADQSKHEHVFCSKPKFLTWMLMKWDMPRKNEKKKKHSKIKTIFDILCLFLHILHQWSEPFGCDISLNRPLGRHGIKWSPLISGFIKNWVVRTAITLNVTTGCYFISYWFLIDLGCLGNVKDKNNL